MAEGAVGSGPTPLLEPLELLLGQAEVVVVRLAEVGAVHEDTALGLVAVAQIGKLPRVCLIACRPPSTERD